MLWQLPEPLPVRSTGKLLADTSRDTGLSRDRRIVRHGLH